MESKNNLHPDNYSRVCPECQTGVMQLQRVTYFTWLDEELITVPDFPARVCDVCGRREYDRNAIQRLNSLLNPEAGRRREVRHSGASRRNPASPQ